MVLYVRCYEVVLLGRCYMGGVRGVVLQGWSYEVLLLDGVGGGGFSSGGDVMLVASCWECLR